MKVNPSDNVVLSLALDHEDCVYRAQRWIKGTVTIERQQAIGSKLSISLVGKNKHETILFEEEQVLHDFLKNEESECTYPFSIFLPGTLAPSMYLEDGPRGCSVCYELTAWYGTHVSVSRSVHIVGPTLSTKTHPYHLAPLCLANDMLLAVHMENTHVAKGRPMNVALSIRNCSSSKVELKRVSVQVMEEVHWKTRCSATQSYAHMLSEHDNVTLPSIHAIPEHHGDSETMLSDMEQDVAPLQNASEISIPIPSTARDSYPGTKRIQVAHALCIRMTTTDPKHSEVTHTIPLVICDPPLNNHRHMPSKESLKDIMTTVWPNDVVPLHENNNNHDSSEHSCPPIEETE